MHDLIPILPSLITALVPVLATVLAFLLQRRKIQQIHVLVNSRLTAALDEITKLRETLSPKAQAESQARVDVAPPVKGK